MRKGGGKQKGSAFERRICKELSLWVSKGEQQDVFWRSAMSGGRSTVALKGGSKLAAQAGDVSAVDDVGMSFIKKFMVECKTYKTLNFESLIKGKGNLIGFWDVAYREAHKYDKLPILIGKQNNYPIITCLCLAGIKHFNIESRVRLIVKPEDLNILLWDDFLGHANPDANNQPRSRRIRL